jgi:hypothetical protein
VMSRLGRLPIVVPILFGSMFLVSDNVSGQTARSKQLHNRPELFSIHRSKSSLSFQLRDRAGHIVVDKELSELECDPVVVKPDNIVIYSEEGQVVAVDHIGKQLWASNTTVSYGVPRLVTTQREVVYYYGFHSEPIPADGESAKGFLATSNEEQRVSAKEIRTGHSIWNRPWLEIGTPEAVDLSGNILSVAIEPPSQSHGRLRHAARFLRMIRSADGRILHSWKLPQWAVINNAHETLMLSEWLRMRGNIWHVSGNSDNQCVNVHSSPYLMPGKSTRGIACDFRITRGSVLRVTFRGKHLTIR